MMLFRSTFFFIFFITINLNAQEIRLIDVNNPARKGPQNQFLYQLKDSFKGITSIDSALNLPFDTFIQNKSSTILDYGFRYPKAVSLFGLQNTGTSRSVIIRVQQSRVDSVQLVIKKTGGQIQQFQPTGRFRPMETRVIETLNHLFEVPIATNEIIYCYLLSNRTFGNHAISMRVDEPKIVIRNEISIENQISFIAGMFIIAGLMGLLLFCFIREPSYFIFAVYSVSSAMLVLSDSGMIHAYFSNSFPQEIINHTTPAFFYLTIGLHLIFNIFILKLYLPKKSFLFWAGFLPGLGFILSFLVLIFFQFSNLVTRFLVDASYFIVFYMDLFLLITTSFVLYKKRETSTLLYLFGILFSIFTATIIILGNLHLIENIDPDANIFYYSPLIEVLLMCVGTSFHFSNIINERFKLQRKIGQIQEQMITVQEEERVRMAQDLHDDMGSSLIVLKNLSEEQGNTTFFNELSTLIDTVRRISHNVFPADFRQFSLQDIIEDHVSKLKQIEKVNFKFVKVGQVVKFKSQAELAIYRIYTELINNVLKHAKPTQVSIQMAFHDECLIISIEDNGVGFNKNIPKNGIGLRSIELRVAYLRAQFEVDSDCKGTQSILSVPYDSNLEK